MDAASVTVGEETLIRMRETTTRPTSRPKAKPSERMPRARDSGMPCATRCLGNQFHTDRKSTRLNSSHLVTSDAVFCLKKESALCLCRHERSWRAAFAGGDLIHGPSRSDGFTRFQDIVGLALFRFFVAMLDQEPVGALAAVAVGAH